MIDDLRCRLAVQAGRLATLAYRLSRRPGDGVSTRGRAILAVDPEALSTLARDRRTVLVTGTNGKTTTAHLTVAAVGGAATNPTGANMPSGIITAYADSRAPIAVVEVDELYLASVMRQVRPIAVVALNLARDQLDRTHEVARIAHRWRQAFAEARPLVIANAADPNVVFAAMDVDHWWFDPGIRWADDAVTCPRCGALIHWQGASWSCTCGLSMPTPQAWVDADGLHLDSGEVRPFELGVPGAANRGNACAAVLGARALDVDAGTALARLASVERVDGRYATIDVGGRPARLVLAKNPASWVSVMSWLGDRPLIVMVNARPADGRDTSWLYDVPFEEYAGRTLGACGERADDVALRLHIAGVRPCVDRDLDALARRMPDGDLQVVATYSAFVQLRRRQTRPR